MLSFDVGKIGLEVILLGVEFGACVHKFRFQGVGAVQVAQNLVHVAHAVDVQFVYHSRFAYIGLGYNQTLVSQLACLDGYGQCSAYGQDGAVQAELAQHHIAAKKTGLYKILCGQYADGHGQVIGRTFLADVCRCEVDGDLLCGEFVTAVLNGSHDAFMAFAHGVVWQADQGKTGASGRIYLDGNRCGLHAFNGCAIQFY